MKIIVDFILASIGLIILMPLFLILAFAIWLEDRGPVFYRQERVGLLGQKFRIWKFRSMRVNSGGPTITVGADKRITRVGRVIRACKLDELPQLINVVRLEMSLVGPRPEVESYVEKMNEEQKKILAFRPGITSPASLYYSREAEILAKQENPHEYYFKKMLPDKVEMDLKYFLKSTFVSDVKIIFRTIGKILGFAR